MNSGEKSEILEMKRSISQIKNSMEFIHQYMDQGEERILQIEGKIKELLHHIAKNEKKNV
jgi:hypothetical protein